MVYHVKCFSLDQTSTNNSSRSHRNLVFKPKIKYNSRRYSNNQQVFSVRSKIYKLKLLISYHVKVRFSYLHIFKAQLMAILDCLKKEKNLQLW